MRRFVGDASHELRTPLAAIRGFGELYRMGALATDEDVAQAMRRIGDEAAGRGRWRETCRAWPARARTPRRTRAPPTLPRAPSTPRQHTPPLDPDPARLPAPPA